MNIELVDLQKYFHISCHQGPEGCRGKKIHALQLAHVQVNLCTRHLRELYESLHTYTSDLRPDNELKKSARGLYKRIDEDPLESISFKVKK